MTTLPTFEDLARLIADASLLRGEFTLRSGRTSHYYLDKYRFSTNPEILQPLAHMFRERIPEGTQRLAGAELEAVDVLEKAGAKVSGVISVINREEGARENIEAMGLKFESLFSVADLGVVDP